MLQVKKLKCGYRENPIGIGEFNPEFSWRIESDQTGILQSDYQIQVSLNAGFTDVLWDSGVVASANSIHVAYSGARLNSRQRYYFRVKIRDNHGNISTWSETAFFETGMLDPKDWKAEFISADQEEHPVYSAVSPYFRKNFAIEHEILSARAYATSLGLYELRINGRKVGDSFLTPGWTSYNKRLQYQTYDVTSLLQAGANTVGAFLGNGWYKGHVASWEENATQKYGSRVAVLIELHIICKDGSSQVISTDKNWKTSFGPILQSEIYDGEIYDATKELCGWDRPDYNDQLWSPVHEIKVDKKILVAQENFPVKKVETLRPVSLFKTPQGDSVLDFGQNMAGWVRFKAAGPKGSRVVLHHAEVLDSAGNFYTANLRSAKQTVEYILKGDGTEAFEPHFTYQGFRYVRVAEYPGEINLENFEGIVLHSNMEKTGDFTCSDALVNQLQHNILWGQKDNFVDIPTDCPQRDERLGWTGDAQIFARTACYNMDVALFYKKWLRDLKADQLPDGQVAFVVPHALTKAEYSSSGWGDAAVICPWTVYLCYGDKRVLEEQYSSMKAWIDYIRSQAHSNLWNTGFHFGDWLALDQMKNSKFNSAAGDKDKQDDYFGATPNDYIATAFYAYSTSLFVKTARVLHNKEDEAEYATLLKEIITAFHNEYFTPAGRLAIHTQTAYVLALMFNLVEEKNKERTVQALLDLLKENDWHLSTGFLGTPYLCHVLSQNGHPEAAYKLLMQTDYPSWLYQVTKGATTVWEHWDGIKPDNTFWSTDMNSFNHYAYGSIGSWLYQVVAGIEIDETQPAYKHIIFRPTPFQTFQWVKATYDSLYGRVSLQWKITNGKLEIVTEVPHNTTATIILTCADAAHLTVNGKPFEAESAVHDGKAILELGSGNWNFSCPYVQ